MPTRNITRDIAKWAAELRFEQIPPRVVNLAKCQAASVFASAHAGLATRAGQRLLASARTHGAPGDIPILATGETFHLDTALQVNAGLGMALDYDDYLFMGHPGHSAVWTAWLLGKSLGSSAEEILTAQVVANEFGGRLGAACIFSPQNGQLWSHIHLGSAALAAGILLGLDDAQMAHALGIAYAQPNYGLFPGFMAPDSKLLTAATPTLTGLQAARYAQAGMTGSPTILEDRKGFLRHFCYSPVWGMLSGWGDAWVLDSLAVKPYPGCAYLDTTIDVILDLVRRIRVEKGKLLPEDVGAVHVEATLLSMEMNRLSVEHFDPEQLSPVNINFNVPVNVAIALLHGALTPQCLTEDALTTDREAIVSLASKVTLSHNWSYSLALLRELDSTLGTQRFFKGMRGQDFGSIMLRARKDLDHGEPAFQLAGLLPAWKAMTRENRSFVRRMASRGMRGLSRKTTRSPEGLEGVDFRQVRMPFASRVTLTLRDGSVYVGQSDLARGTTARGDVMDVTHAKLVNELSATCRPEQARQAWATLQDFETVGVHNVLSAVTASRPAQPLS